MDSNEPEVIELGALKPGDTIQLPNGTQQALRYTFECGEYGKISFDLIIGGTINITAGTAAPKIVSSDPE